MIDLNNRLKEFTTMHDDFLANWNEAMKTGNTRALDRMTDDYYVAFFKRGNEKPMYFSKEESISGMEESIIQFLGAQKKFENRVIRLRDSENAIVFYEMLVVQNEELLARLFTIENWMLIDGKWMIVRETEEPIS